MTTPGVISSALLRRRTSQLRCAAFAVLAGGLVLGCESDPAEEDGPDQATSSAATDDPDNPGDDAGWRMSYSGAQSGEIFGPSTSAISILDTVSFGGTNLDFDAAYSIVGTLPIEAGNTATIEAENFSAELADGTVCSESENATVSVTVTNGELDAFAMEFSGTLDCDGPLVEIDGFLRRQ